MRFNNDDDNNLLSLGPPTLERNSLDEESQEEQEEKEQPNIDDADTEFLYQNNFLNSDNSYSSADESDSEDEEDLETDDKLKTKSASQSPSKLRLHCHPNVSSSNIFLLMLNYILLGGSITMGVLSKVFFNAFLEYCNHDFTTAGFCSNHDDPCADEARDCSWWTKHPIDNLDRRQCMFYCDESTNLRDISVGLGFGGVFSALAFLFIYLRTLYSTRSTNSSSSSACLAVVNHLLRFTLFSLLLYAALESPDGPNETTSLLPM